MREAAKVAASLLLGAFGLLFLIAVNVAFLDWITTPRCCEHCPATPAPAREETE